MEAVDGLCWLLRGKYAIKDMGLMVRHLPL